MKHKVKSFRIRNKRDEILTEKDLVGDEIHIELKESCIVVYILIRDPPPFRVLRLQKTIIMHYDEINSAFIEWDI